LVGEAELVGELINRQHRAERPTARATRVALSRSPPTGAVKRRALVVIEATTSALLVVSLAVVWMLPTHATGLLVEARGVAFGIFTLSAWTLLVAVLIDFDRWVGTVRPVPKRLVRRFVARVARALGRAPGWMLACYGAAMTWLWNAVLRALAWALGGSGTALTRTWVWLTRAATWTLVRYRRALTWTWNSFHQHAGLDARQCRHRPDPHLGPADARRHMDAHARSIGQSRDRERD